MTQAEEPVFPALQLERLETGLARLPVLQQLKHKTNSTQHELRHHGGNPALTADRTVSEYNKIFNQVLSEDIPYSMILSFILLILMHS